jgi:hypothetical protein
MQPEGVARIGAQRKCGESGPGFSPRFNLGYMLAGSPFVLTAEVVPPVSCDPGGKVASSKA